MSNATTHERLAAWLDGEAALYRERAQRAEAAQDWDPAVRYAGAADALVQLRDRVLRGLAAIFGQWPGDETDEEIEAALAEMERCHCGGDAEIARLTRELEALRRIAVDFHWMARRYADGRSSYVTGLFNDYTRALLAMGVELNPTGDGTIWARDAMGRAYDGLTDEEAAQGSPMPRGLHDEDVARLRRELEEARALLRELTGHEPVLDDERLRYVEIQVDRQTWDEVCAFAARQQGGSE